MATICRHEVCSGIEFLAPYNLTFGYDSEFGLCVWYRSDDAPVCKYLVSEAYTDVPDDYELIWTVCFKYHLLRKKPQLRFGVDVAESRPSDTMFSTLNGIRW